MTRPVPLLIVSLPARGVEEARVQRDVARDAGADVAELRIDRFPEPERARLSALFPSPIPLLGTYRSRAEGGEGADDPEVRRRVLSGMARLPFAFIDREIRRDLVVDGPPTAEPGPDRTPPLEVRSIHFDRLPAAQEIGRWLRSPSGPSVFVKVVAPATLTELWDRVLPELPPRGERSIVLHTTGPSGPVLRALAADLELAAAYCALPEGSGSGGAAPIEPAQIPVDRLRWHFASGGGAGHRFAVVGHPIHHSRSPRLHSTWMRMLDLHGLYVALDLLSEAEFVASVPELAEAGFRGLNVTHPWKQPALALADSASPAAERCGCANTLTFEGDEVRADNTDLAAVLRRLTELKQAGTWGGEALAIVGAGGAARAALEAARTLGASVTLLARDPAKGRALAEEFDARLATGEAPGVAELLLHATPAGRTGAGPLGVDLDGWVGPGSHVIDFVDRPDDPFLSRAAGAADATYEDGGRLLAYQAATAFEAWWGRPVPAEALETAAGGWR